MEAEGVQGPVITLPACRDRTYIPTLSTGRLGPITRSKPTFLSFRCFCMASYRPYKPAAFISIVAIGLQHSMAFSGGYFLCFFETMGGDAIDLTLALAILPSLASDWVAFMLYTLFQQCMDQKTYILSVFCFVVFCFNIFSRGFPSIMYSTATPTSHGVG
jgi:hypothetical protein